MTLDEFRNEASGAPISLGEMAQWIVDELEDPMTEADELADKAEAFLKAKMELEMAMEKTNVELG